MATSLVENIESQEQYKALVAKTATPKPPSATMESAKVD